ncbi:DNA repair exonuclease [Rickenella mellea]|uniref:Double-strand break repair protein n=1 Tax=Rickenella mellea TaxID=50990 RepID=A0A4Y7PHM7_9AGAM|nr:DNA repair exonuclease [Rickenella mellea]
MSEPPPDHQSPPPPTLYDQDEDTIKIMLATDNHIGYMERDPIRGQDAINTFEEILKLAVKNDVDFVLLAGDLFHENRPSRDCLYRVAALLREYTLNDRPVQIELLSNPDEGKAPGFSFPAVNYEDPNLNVGIPVFSIHGNHDDPQGAGPEGALCALDLLSVTGLINYMGKIDIPTTEAEVHPETGTGGIAVRPVLLRKGTTRLGLYGIGNVKDARMHFELRSNRVRMFMPRDKQDWFNIMLVHQNRVAHGPQEYVPEAMFDNSINLVVWGHEHDCRIVPEPVAGKNYYITQPGSSVATSLADGESLEKHVALIQIRGKEFNLEPIPLRTVRPFVLEEIFLTEVAEEEGFDIADQMEVVKFLKAKVNELIAKANEQWEERNTRAVERGEQALKPMLPLIRLKVDTTGAEMSNPIRFGQEFTGRIANPRDVLVFHRSKRSATKSKGKGGADGEDEPVLSIDDPALTTSEKLAKVRVQTLVREYLAAQELQLLGESGLSDAIQTFVEKDDPHAIQGYVSTSLKALMKTVGAEGQVEEDDLDDALSKAREQHEKEYQEKTNGKAASSSKGKGKAKDSDADSVDSMTMDVDGDDSDAFAEPPPKKTTAKGKKAAAPTPAKKAPAKKGRGKKAVESEDELESPVDEIDDEEEPEQPKAKKATNRAAVLSQPSAGKKAPAKKKAAAASSAKQSTLTFAPAGRASARSAATKARGKMQEVVELESDDE